jgi:hypothetical protein
MAGLLEYENIPAIVFPIDRERDDVEFHRSRFKGVD